MFVLPFPSVQAAFVLFFDDKEPVTLCDGGNCDDLSAYCKDLLHGAGHMRWFDKSITIIIYANGKVGVVTSILVY